MFKYLRHTYISAISCTCQFIFRLWTSYHVWNQAHLHLSETVLLLDIHVESKCFAPTYLELDCDSSSDSVISIIWNATFFGQSECGSPNSCCPDDTDCTVLVMEVDNWHDDHLEQLKACNGETTCSVRVTRIDHVCPAATDYETVTYQCVPPEISSTAATLGPTIHGQTDRWTNTGRNQTTSPETEYTGISISRQHHVNKRIFTLFIPGDIV